MLHAPLAKAVGKKRIQYFACLGTLVALASLIDSHEVLAELGSGPSSSRLDPAMEAAYIKKASELDDNPADAKAVQEVCTACHSSTQFLTTPRSSVRWEQLFEQMSSYGASPTDDQVDEIVRYFQRNLTVVNVNTSPAEELAPTLQVTDAVANEIVARRARKKFNGIADLAAVAGINNVVLEKLKGRLQF